MKNGDLFSAWEGAQDGAARAADHAESVSPGWNDEAFYLLQRFAERRGGQPFMIEDVRQFAEDYGLDPPPDGRAWGAVALRAKRAGLIIRAGFGSTTHGPAHTHPRNKWRLVQPEPSYWPTKQAVML